MREKYRKFKSFIYMCWVLHKGYPIIANINFKKLEVSHVIGLHIYGCNFDENSDTTIIANGMSGVK